MIKTQATVRLTWNDQKKSWLLTAFEKKNSASNNTTDTVGTLAGEGNDTATSQNTVSGNKDNVPSSNIQTSGEENSQPIAESPKPQSSKPESFDELNERLRVLDIQNRKEEFDYIKQHYPSQTTNAALRPENRAEREAMMKDPVLNKMKERHHRIDFQEKNE